MPQVLRDTAFCLPTAATGGRNISYTARYNFLTDHSQLLMSQRPDSAGTVIYDVVGHTIDALTMGDFRGAGGFPKLIVGMNGLHGHSPGHCLLVTSGSIQAIHTISNGKPTAFSAKVMAKWGYPPLAVARDAE
jgi:hypothetical protein